MASQTGGYDKIIPASGACRMPCQDRSEEHTSELQSLMRISYAVFCLKKKTLVLNGLAAQQRGTSNTASANGHPTALIGETLPEQKHTYILTHKSEPALTTHYI